MGGNFAKVLINLIPWWRASSLLSPPLDIFGSVTDNKYVFRACRPPGFLLLLDDSRSVRLVAATHAFSAGRKSRGARLSHFSDFFPASLYLFNCTFYKIMDMHQQLISMYLREEHLSKLPSKSPIRHSKQVLFAA